MAAENKSVDVFIEHLDTRSPFFIEPRCRLARMK
jgi:hypothetical protein